MCNSFRIRVLKFEPLLSPFYSRAATGQHTRSQINSGNSRHFQKDYGGDAHIEKGFAQARLERNKQGRAGPPLMKSKQVSIHLILCLSRTSKTNA